MTPSLFAPADLAALVSRLESLRPDAAARWGKMAAPQMLAHCQRPLEVAVGELVLKRNLLGRLFGGLAKRKLAGPKPFDRGLPTAPQFVVKDGRDFPRERARLLELLRTFHRRGPEGLAKEHPFFGPMTPAEWDLLQWKHLDHHLRQFGA